MTLLDPGVNRLLENIVLVCSVPKPGGWNIQKRHKVFHLSNGQLVGENERAHIQNQSDKSSFYWMFSTVAKHCTPIDKEKFFH